MNGTSSQIEWAEQIRPRVNAEFDRVANAFEQAARKQGDRDRTDTQAIIAILEEKRREVLGRDQAGYFVREWQELTDQVRQMIAKDSRYQEIRSNARARRASARTQAGS